MPNYNTGTTEGSHFPYYALPYQPAWAPALQNPVEPAAVPQAPAPNSRKRASSSAANQVKAPPSTHRIPDLDNPEELERWKAERRKKFPRATESEPRTTAVESSNNTVEADAGNDIVPYADSIANAVSSDSEEDGAISEDLAAAPTQSKRTCKYFARGKCRNGDQCLFLHSAVSKPQRKGTLFERLVADEEAKDLLRFYDFIKSIVNMPQ